MRRHAMALNPAVWTAARRPVARLTAPWPSDGVHVLRHPDGVTGRFRVALTRDFLEVAGDIVEPAGWDSSSGRLHPEWYFRDHLAVLLDPGHDHATRRMVAVLRGGEVRTEDAWHLAGEEATDVFREELKLTPLRPEVRVTETRRGWRLLVRIARRRLRGAGGRPEAGALIGLQLRWGVAGALLRPAVCWPPADARWDDGPFGFGDLIESDACFAVTGLDFGEPVWKTDDVTSRLRLRGRLRRPAPRQGTIQTVVVGTDGVRRAAAHPWRARRDTLRADIPVDYPFTSKWAPDVRKIARLEISIQRADGRALWHASYPFGFDAGIIVREPFGLLGRSAAGARRPGPEDPAFVDKYRAWLLRRLPDWLWTTTRTGAPSDFYLRAKRREDDVDMMRPDAIAALARLVRRKFDEWQDALCAASLMLHHPCLTAHSPAWSRVAGCAETGTVLRLGGCFCSETARLAAVLAEALGPLYGVRLKGYTLGLRGHITGLVETPLGDVPVDPMLGIYYHTLDNRRLATMREMQADPRIALRMWAFPRARDGRPLFAEAPAPIKRPCVDGSLMYPPGGVDGGRSRKSEVRSQKSGGRR